jgi:formylmethanofuran dehydrogenase subunit E
MGMLAGRLLDVDLPRADKRLLTIVETDGCAADGVAVATGCWLGRRTLRVEDYGKVAATVVDTTTGYTVRVLPSRMSRALATTYAPGVTGRWEAQLVAYQHMPDDLLLEWHEVELAQPLAAILSSPDARSVCVSCGEEIINQRELVIAGAATCRACAGDAYYRPTGAVAATSDSLEASLNAMPIAFPIASGRG